MSEIYVHTFYLGTLPSRHCARQLELNKKVIPLWLKELENEIWGSQSSWKKKRKIVERGKSERQRAPKSAHTSCSDTCLIS